MAEASQLQEQLNVVIVDDHVALRRGMELLLRRSGLHVVGTADDAEQAEALILRRRPDVAVIDLALPGESGAALTRRLLDIEPELRIILYTGSADEDELLDGLHAGAAGFALKSGDPEELQDAIRQRIRSADVLVHIEPGRTGGRGGPGRGRSGSGPTEAG